MGTVRNRKSSQERVRLKDRELRHAQEGRDNSEFIGLDAPAAVFKIGHGACVYTQRAREIRGLESRGLSQPPDLAADRHLHGKSMGESCGNRKSLWVNTGSQTGMSRKSPVEKGGGRAPLLPVPGLHFWVEVVVVGGVAGEQGSLGVQARGHIQGAGADGDVVGLVRRALHHLPEQ